MVGSGPFDSAPLATRSGRRRQDVAPQALQAASVRSESRSCAVGDRARRAAQRRGALCALAGGVAVLALALALHAPVGGASRHVRGPRGGRGLSASLRRVGDHGELIVSGMRQPPFGEAYEVWLLRPGRPPAATDALFAVTAAGSATVDVPGPLSGVRDVMVTPEPLGGSASPTAPAALSVTLPGTARGG
ncbi:MAG TPA: anti-sigma factor [Solirubrobacteraceae bacterium]